MAKRARPKAGRLIYTLHQDCLNDEGVPGNIWQYRRRQGGTEGQARRPLFDREAGELRNYTAECRPALVTLFFLGERPPQNITLHGAHDFSLPGDAIGSVSAASSAFKTHIGKQFKTRRTVPTSATVITLTIG